MEKTTVKSPANIAFIKYWGKKDKDLRLPLNNSISMNLSGAFSLTTVEFSPDFKRDEIEMVGEEIGEKEKERIIEHLDRVRKMARVDFKARVKTKNNFPKGTGIASSASGFSALSLAASRAAGLKLSLKEVSVLARLGSGSACRSVPDGFVEWEKGNSNSSSYAYSLYPPGYWNLADLVILVSAQAKKVGSTEGHSMIKSSPFTQVRIDTVGQRLKKIKKALREKDFTLLGETIEAEALNMHAVMMTSQPPLFYWSPKTLELMLAIRAWREEGLEGYFTLDAGPTVHLICQKKDVRKMKKELSSIKGLLGVIVNYPSLGARVVKDHLF